MENNKDKELCKLSLYNWLDEWLEVYAKPTVKEKTYLTYYYSIRHIKNFIDNNPLEEVREIDCQRILNLMAENNYAKSTIVKVKVLLQRAFFCAIRNNLIHNNCATELKIPQASVKRVVSLSQEEQRVVEQACEVVKNGDLALFLLKTGLRAREMCQLKWSNYNNVKSEIKVVDSKTKAGIRTVPLIKVAKEIIEKQPKINEYIFTTAQQKQITMQVLKRLYERLRKHTGINKITNHVYRHSFATRALERGMNPKALSEILGHADVAFTLKTYTHIGEEYLHEQMSLMEE